jgi:hypothetical protein
VALPKIEHPLFDVIIPSTKQKIKCRPMLVKEEKILLMAKQSEHDSDIYNAIYQVVNNCIVDKKTKIDNLAIFDIEYLYLKIRAFSVNNVAKQRYIDQEDQKTYEFEVNLEKLELQFPKDISNIVEVNDKVSILLKYPPAALYSQKEILRDKENLDTKILISCIDKITEGDKMFKMGYGQEGTDEFVEFFDNLPINASNKVKEFANTLPSFEHVIEYTNTKGTKRVIKLTSVTDFFIF